jgi:aspartate/methionine/tyrosine aminotransferase
MMPQAGYFIMANTESIDVEAQDPRGRDYDVCTWLTKEIGVTAIPTSSFYESKDGKSGASKFARFALNIVKYGVGLRSVRLRRTLKQPPRG